MSDLEAQLLTAHDQNDKAALVALYTQAANESMDEDQAGFFLTQAYIFALDCGAREAADLNRRLAEQGREVLQDFP